MGSASGGTNGEVSGYNVLIGSSARDEIREAHQYYFDRSERAARSFLEAVDDAIALIKVQPCGSAILQGDLRHLTLKRYPYAIYYRVVGTSIFIVGCIHGKRHPRTWRKLV